MWLIDNSTMENRCDSKIIVRLPDKLSDLVNALPIFSILRQNFLNSSITALIESKNASLLKGLEIDHILEFEKKPRFAPVLKNGEDVITFLQKKDYDIGIVMPWSFSAYYLFYQGMVKRRIGFHKPFCGFMLTDIVNEDSYKDLLTPLKIKESSWEVSLFAENRNSNVLQVGMQGFFDKKGPSIKWTKEFIHFILNELPSAEVILFGNTKNKKIALEFLDNFPKRVSFLSTNLSLPKKVNAISSLSVLVAKDRDLLSLTKGLNTAKVDLSELVTSQGLLVEDMFLKIREALLDSLKNTSEMANFSEYEPIESGVVSVSNRIKEDKKIGVIILAGGMGRRLGFDKPKGFLSLGNQTLYDILLKKADGADKIGILTSPITFEKTWDYIKDKKVDLFTKKAYPTECGSGVSPEGNGALFEAVVYSRFWNEWKDLDLISVIAIDNPLADPLDAELLSTQKELAVIGVGRDKNEEKLGVLCKKGKSLAVREYFTLKKDGMEGLGYSGSFAAKPKFFEAVAKESLPFYRVKKKQQVFFERLLIDGFSYAEDFDVIEKERSKCFFPIKEKKDVFNYCKLQGIGGSK
ncbi:MAG: hypothetical protein S4CHLAM20_12900 [Chlamydiia bacterium]|nr:hypothetical protein [Chlamydiia bacterium]